MINFAKKALAVLAASALVLAAAGCQKKEAIAPDGGKIVKAGFIYVGSANDGGFSTAHDVARKALADKYSWLQTKYIESVPEGKASPVISQFVQDEKCDVIFTCSFGYMDETIETAKKFPSTVFMHCSGFKQSENVGTFFADLYQMYYLNGLMAGALTKSGKVGYVGAFPTPEVVRHIDAYALGVKATNPKATVDVRWINAWYDPAKAGEAAQALIASGCDALAFTEDSARVVEIGEESSKAGKQIYTFGHYSPMADKGPDTLVSGQLVNWTPMYDKILNDVRNGTWKNQDMSWFVAQGAVELGGKSGEPVNPKFVPALQAVKVKTADLGEISAYDLAMKRLEQMKQTPVAFEPFTGPIKDNSGKERYAAGAVAPYTDLLKIDYFVDNIISKMPESK